MFTRSLSFVTAIALASPAVAQSIIMPESVIAGEPVPVIVAGLSARQQVTIIADRVMSNDGRPAAYRAEAQFVADPSGRIDVARVGPVAGDYSGADAAGLFWSMRPVAAIPPDVAAGTARLTVMIAGRAVTSRTVRFITFDPKVVSEAIDGFSGAMLFKPKTTRRLPVVIALGGSEGGSSFGRDFGPWLASKGYAVVALPYYAPGWSSEKLPGLPVDFADIPVDRLEQVHRWIAGRADLDRRHVGLYGVSKGGEFAVIAASRFYWIKAVAAIVPSDVVWEGWGTNVPADDTRSSFSWGGKPLAFVPYKGMRETIAALSRGDRRALTVPHAEGKIAFPARVAAARIPIERYRGALLVAGGGKDETWPSGEMAKNIGMTRKKAGLPTTVLTFADAGHGLAGSGWEPENYPQIGSSPAATAHAQILVRKATLALFAKALR